MNRKLRILEVNKFYAPHIGGIETLIEQRAKHFAKRDDVEVKVLVCQEKGKGTTEMRDGVEVIRCGSLGTYFSCPLSFASRSDCSMAALRFSRSTNLHSM